MGEIYEVSPNYIKCKQTKRLCPALDPSYWYTVVAGFNQSPRTKPIIHYTRIFIKFEGFINTAAVICCVSKKIFEIKN